MKKWVCWTWLVIGLILLGVSFLRFKICLETFTLGNLIWSISFLWIGVVIFMSIGDYSTRGKPRESLPDGKRFSKISALKLKGNYLLWLRKISDKSESSVLFYRIPIDTILLDKNGDSLQDIPEEFLVIKSKRIMKEKRFKKRPEMEEVYYLLP